MNDKRLLLIRLKALDKIKKSALTPEEFREETKKNIEKYSRQVIEERKKIVLRSIY